MWFGQLVTLFEQMVPGATFKTAPPRRNERRGTIRGMQRQIIGAVGTRGIKNRRERPTKNPECFWQLASGEKEMCQEFFSPPLPPFRQKANAKKGANIQSTQSGLTASKKPREILDRNKVTDGGFRKSHQTLLLQTPRGRNLWQK